MINPNKHIRKALVDLLSVSTGVPFYESSIPIDVMPLPQRYGIITEQTRTLVAVNKHVHEWLCSAKIEVYSVNELGFNSNVDVDDMEQDVITAMPGLSVAGFKVRLVRFVNSTSVPVTTLTQTIARNVIVYELGLDNVTT